MSNLKVDGHAMMSVWDYLNCWPFLYTTLTVPIRTNQTPEQIRTKPRDYLQGLLGVYSESPFCKFEGFFSHSNRILLGFTRGFLLDALKCEVDPFLILPSFACNSCTLYIPNTHVASAFRCILLIRVYSLCSLWVYFTMFTLDLLWVHSSRPVVNPAFTPKC